MGRTYKRRVGSRNYRNYSDETVGRAMAAYRNNEGSLTDIGERYGVPVATLYRKVKNMNQKNPGGQCALSSTDEAAIVNCISIAADWGFPLKCDDIRELVKNYLNRRGVRISLFNENRPGKEWYLSFMQRHKDALSQRLSQTIKESRAKIDRGTINQYFDNLTNELENVDPAAIVNYDETNFTDDPGRSKVIVRRGSKRAEKIMDTSKAATSVMFSVAASGNMLPIYVVYKADHIWSSWTEGGPPGTRYNRSKSGWFDTNLFEDWFCTVALPYFQSLPEKKILFGDNLASHISVQVISLCEENNIKFILLPPNSTHLTQPLDVSYFRPIKKSWRNVLRVWKRSNKGVVRKDVFPRLLNQTIREIDAQNAKNIRSGFEATGIFPVCRDKILRKLPEEVVTNEEAETHAALALQNIFKEVRYGKENPGVKARRKKLNIQAGKSISLEDVQEVGPSTSVTLEPTKGAAKNKAKKQQKKQKNNEDTSDSEGEWEELLKKKRPWSRRFSDTGSEDEPSLYSNDENSQTETTGEHQELIQTNEVENVDPFSQIDGDEIKEKDFVIVELKTVKNIPKNFVAQIVSKEGSSYMCSYLRQHSKIPNAFVFPWIKEESPVEKNDIKRKLINPIFLRRGAIKFSGLKNTDLPSFFCSY